MVAPPLVQVSVVSAYSHEFVLPLNHVPELFYRRSVIWRIRCKLIKQQDICSFVSIAVILHMAHVRFIEKWEIRTRKSGSDFSCIVKRSATGRSGVYWQPGTKRSLKQRALVAFLISFLFSCILHKLNADTAKMEKSDKPGCRFVKSGSNLSILLQFMKKHSVLPRFAGRIKDIT